MSNMVSEKKVDNEVVAILEVNGTQDRDALCNSIRDCEKQ